MSALGAPVPSPANAVHEPNVRQAGEGTGAPRNRIGAPRNRVGAPRGLALRARLGALADNPMFFKDLTQWIRRRTFGTLFLGLLVGAELVSVLIVLVPSDPGIAGPATFGFLMGLLALYGVVIAVSGYLLTAQEYANRTFELYELSGLTVEKMAFGKFLSMFAQFLFGFACVVPYVFFAFLQGGLDFVLLCVGVFGLLILTLPFYLGALSVALLTRNKAIQIVVRILMVLGSLFVLQTMFGLIVAVFGMRGAGFGVSPLDGVVRYLGLLVTFDARTLAMTALSVALYAEVCLTLFYVACHALCPSSDSRQTAVLTCAILAIVTWMAAMLGPGIVRALSAWAAALSTGSTSTVTPAASSAAAFAGAAATATATGYLYTAKLYGTLTPVALLACLLGAAFAYRSAHLPTAVRARRRKRSLPGVRLVQAFLAPTGWGAWRALVLMGLLALIGVWAYPAPTSLGPLKVGSWPIKLVFQRDWNSDGFRAASFVFQVPWFVAFPAILFAGRRRYGIRAAPKVAVIAICWWIFVGILALIGTLAATSGFEHFETPRQIAMGLMALALSPISSYVSEASGSEFPTAVIRTGLGLLGLVLLAFLIRDRSRAEQPNPGAAHAADTEAVPALKMGALPSLDRAPSEEPPHG